MISSRLPAKVVLPAIAALLLVVLTGLYVYSFTDFTLTRKGEKTETVSFPFLQVSQKPDGVYTLEGDLRIRPLSPRQFVIIPDDVLLELRINGENVDLSSYSEEQLRDWQNGFAIDLSDHLRPGDNSISFVFRDYTGLYGIRMLSDFSEPRLVLFRALWVASLGVLVWSLLMAVNVRKDLAILVMGGVAVRLLYTLVTDFNVRGHDTDEHIDYVMHFVNTWRLPHVEYATGGAYFHPPFYYFIASIFYKISQFFYPGQPRLGYGVLQYVSVAFSTGFMIYSCLLVRLFFDQVKHKDKPFVRLGTLRLNLIPTLSFVTAALIIFWPSAVLHSPRIGNDPLLYFFFLGGIYHIYTFFLHPTRKRFFFGALLTGLAIISKANGAILVALGGIVLLTMWFKSGRKPDMAVVRKGIAPSLLIVFALALAFYPGVALKLSGERTHLYIDNITNIPATLQTGNTAVNYLWMDIETFITKPYTSPYTDEYGRQYFANYLSKTGLVGEWWFDGLMAENTTVIISVCYLVMMVFLLVGLYRLDKADLYMLSPILWVYFLLLASIYYMRMTFPANIDFRYILPAIVPFALLYNYGLMQLSRSGSNRLALIGCAVEITFIVNAILFILHLNL